MNIFRKKKKYRVRAFIQEKDKYWSTHFNQSYNTKEEAQKIYDEIYNQWKKYIDDGTFDLEDIWEHE